MAEHPPALCRGLLSAVERQVAYDTLPHFRRLQSALWAQNSNQVPLVHDSTANQLLPRRCLCSTADDSTRFECLPGQ